MTNPGSATSHRTYAKLWQRSLSFGIFGADRFYLGKTWTGILKLLTLGGLGVWWVIDLAISLAGRSTDKEGRVIASPSDRRQRAKAWGTSAAVVALSAAAPLALG